MLKRVQPYVTIYATFSHLYDDLLTNQRLLKLKPLSTNIGARHRENVKVLRRLLRTVFSISQNLLV